MAQERRINWLNVTTVVSAAILIGAEVFGAAFAGSWAIAIETARELKAMKKQYPRLDLQTCTCFMHSNQDTIFEWYEFLKHDLKPDKVNFNYIRPPSADPKTSPDVAPKYSPSGSAPS